MIVSRLLENVFTFKKLVGHQLTIVVLEVSHHIHHSVVDSICCPFSDIHEVHFLDNWNDLLHNILIYSRHFSKQAHFIGVRDPHVRICVGGCAIWDDERTEVDWVDKVSG